MCQEAVQSAGLSIVAQCLICPVLDFEETSPSRETFAEGHLIDRVTIEADLADYLPDGIDVADPRISPLRATRLAGLPTAIIHTAEFDPMRDEGNAYARKLLAAGVTVEHICHDGMVHNFHAMGAILPQAQLVLSQIGEQVPRGGEIAAGDMRKKRETHARVNHGSCRHDIFRPMRVRVAFGLMRTRNVGRMRCRDHPRKAFFGHRRVIGHRRRRRGGHCGRSHGEPRQSGEQDAA